MMIRALALGRWQNHKRMYVFASAAKAETEPFRLFIAPKHARRLTPQRISKRNYLKVVRTSMAFAN